MVDGAKEVESAAAAAVSAKGCQPTLPPAHNPPWPLPRPSAHNTPHAPQIEQLDEKLGEVEAERAELQAYQRHDRTRRSLEYTVYDRELTKIKADLERVRQGCGKDAWIVVGCC